MEVQCSINNSRKLSRCILTPPPPPPFLPQAVLKVEHKGSLFISNLLTLPCLSAKGKGRGKSNETASEDSLSDVLLALTPVSQSIEIGTKPEHVSEPLKHCMWY